MKIIVFDIWGDLGHFRMPYTTSSPLTFPIPPKTALYGIIGAILGYDKDNYLKKFQDKSWKFAVSIKSEISTIRIPENFINTKEVKMFSRMPKGKSCRTQINMEFLKNPYYRVYVSSINENEFNKLETFLKAHKSTYTISLGLSECLANFDYIGTFSSQIKQNSDFINISSIVPLNLKKEFPQIDFLVKDTKYLRVHVPLEMKSDRELIENGDFVLEATGKAIKCKSEACIYLEELDEYIFLF